MGASEPEQTYPKYVIAFSQKTHAPIQQTQLLKATLWNQSDKRQTQNLNIEYTKCTQSIEQIHTYHHKHIK